MTRACLDGDEKEGRDCKYFFGALNQAGPGQLELLLMGVLPGSFKGAWGVDTRQGWDL